MNLAYQQSESLMCAEDLYEQEDLQCASAIAQSWIEEEQDLSGNDSTDWDKWHQLINKTPNYCIDYHQNHWDYDNTLPTGRFTITVSCYYMEMRDGKIVEGYPQKVDECRPHIHDFGNTVKAFSKRYSLKLTEQEIENMWNSAIVSHNRKHKGMFKKIFVREHKKYLSEFFEGKGTGDREYLVLWQGPNGYKDILIKETEKAYLLELPIVGSKWIPKKAIYVRGNNYCLHKYIANEWCFWYL